MDIMPIVISITVFGSIKIQAIGLQPHRWKYLERIMYEISFVETEEQLKQVLDFCYNILYCTPVEFAVQPDCRPPARYFPGGITVNPGGLQYRNCRKITAAIALGKSPEIQ